jgi:hypothetical protein
VELIGRYSNLCDQGERIRDLVAMAPSGPKLAQAEHRQLQNRLTADQVEHLVTAYVSGATVKNLVEEFKVHRVTVFSLLDRAGVPRRSRRLSSEEIESAKRLYESGLSLALVGETLGWNADTIRRALINAGVSVRARRGWPIPTGRSTEVNITWEPTSDSDTSQKCTD